jgi:hypothetical protein
MTLEDLARWVFEELDPELSYILWHDHYHPLYDSILGFLWGYYRLFCDPDFTQGLSVSYI